MAHFTLHISDYVSVYFRHHFLERLTVVLVILHAAFQLQEATCILNKYNFTVFLFVACQ